MKHRQAAALALLLILTLSLCGCAQKEYPPPAKTIGLAISSLSTDSGAALYDEIWAAADLYAWEVLTLDADSKAELQPGQIETLVSTGVDAILIDPLDPSLLTEAVQAAAASGIPVCCIGAELEPEAMDCLFFHVGPDIYDLTYAGCRWLADNYAGQRAQTAMIAGTAGLTDTERARQAYTDTLSASDLVNLGSFTGHATVVTTASFTERFLNEHPDLRLLFCQNATILEGAVQAILDAERETELSVAAILDSADDLNYIEDGLLDCAVYIQTAKCGSYAVEALAAYFSSETVPPRRSYLAPALITAENYQEAGTVQFRFYPTA